MLVFVLKRDFLSFCWSLQIFVLIVTFIFFFFFFDLTTQIEQTRATRKSKRMNKTGVDLLSWFFNSNKRSTVLSYCVNSLNRLLPSNQDKGCTPSLAQEILLLFHIALVCTASPFMCVPFPSDECYW